jgi:triacylglycerol esterase/lipase EstA (alpha/beta hydrolase family)
VPPKPPSKLLLAAELPRAVYGAFELVAWQRRLARAPRGDGRPVLILPGLVNPDWANIALRRYLRRLGYDARGWGLGPNLGARSVGREAEKLDALVKAVFEERGEKVTLVGVSLGGMMARLMAHRWPDRVREVITISSPFAGDPKATNVWRLFELLTGEKVTDEAVRANQALIGTEPKVPTTAIWSRSDGLVSGAICRNGECRSIEVRSGHVWVQMRASVLLALAKVLGEGRGAGAGPAG